MSSNAPTRLLAALVTALLTSLVPAAPGHAYEGRLHQQLTFIAAKHFNRCVTGSDIPRLTPLEVRYVAKTNVAQADRNIFKRMFNWRYYDRGRQAERSFLWAVDTRFHEHFNEVIGRLDRAADTRQRYSNLGRLISYVQVVSSPAHTVPVYTARFWRFNLADRFDVFPIDEAQLNANLDCSFLHDPAADYHAVMRAVAEDTLAAVRAPISGLPASWEAFWRLAEEAGNFGEYGPAGNSFGRKTEFRCEAERCVLLRDDPLYVEFAGARHLAAVNGTMRAMLLMQQQRPSAAVAEAE